MQREPVRQGQGGHHAPYGLDHGRRLGSTLISLAHRIARSVGALQASLRVGHLLAQALRALELLLGRYPSAEVAVTQRLSSFAQGKTVLLVTHRTSLLSLVDRAIVIDNGRVVADGPRERIMQALQSGRISKAA